MKRRWFVGMTCNRGTIVDGPYPSPNPKDGHNNRRWLVECKCGRSDVVPQSCLSQHGKCVDCRTRDLIKYPEAKNVAEVVGITIAAAKFRLSRGDANPYIPYRHWQTSKWKAVYGKTLQEMADERGITREAVRMRIEKYGHPGSVGGDAMNRLTDDERRHKWSDPAGCVPTPDGRTFNPTLDLDRLGEQHKAVFALMDDGQWRTLAEIERATGFPQASISARLRDFRKPKFGGYVVKRRRRSPGTHEYRVETT